MSAQTTTIPNTGADRLRTAVLRRAAEPVYVRECVVAPPALVAALAAGYMIRATFEFLETPARIEYSPFVFFVRYHNKPFLGLSWGEITSMMPVKTRFRLMGEPLYDLKLSVIHGKDKVIGNLSLSAGRTFITAFQQYAKKLPPDEAAKVSDKWFHIKTF